MGLTTKGSIGAQTARSLDDCVRLVQEMHDAAVAINPDVIVLCHGGPIAEPDDARYVLSRTRGVVGFFGASSMERLPTEVAITENMRRFKELRAGEPDVLVDGDGRHS
jgi:predicted TIM-barrel enzyme